jgi:hypothetical protein
LLIAIAAIVGCQNKPNRQTSPAAEAEPWPPGKPGVHVRSTAMAAKDWTDALPLEYPAEARKGMTDEQLAKELDVRAWAFDFVGGPFQCWLEFEEAGQRTMPTQYPASERSRWFVDAAHGHFVFSVGRTGTLRMKPILDTNGVDGSPEKIALNLRYRNPADVQTGRFGISYGAAPMWFRWAEKFTARPSNIRGGAERETVTLLRIEAEEASPEVFGQPRRAIIELKAAFGKLPKRTEAD